MDQSNGRGSPERALLRAVECVSGRLGIRAAVHELAAAAMGGRGERGRRALPGPTVESEPLSIAECDVCCLVVRKHRDDARMASFDRRHAMRRILAPEDIERAGRQRQSPHVSVFACQEARYTVVVRVRVAPKAAAVLEFAARHRRLQEHGRGESPRSKCQLRRSPAR